MRTHKYLPLILLLLIVLRSLVSSTAAHPGDTDANGGHTDRNTGEYHYHHGYEAHQHPDGQCPFDFDDKTGWNSGTSSGSSSSSKNSPSPTEHDFDDKTGWNSGTSSGSSSSSEDSPAPTEHNTASSQQTFLEFLLDFLKSAIPAALFYGGPFLLYWLVSSAIERFKHRKHRKELLAKYGAKNRNQIAEMCGMPAFASLDSDDLPCANPDYSSPNTYVFYIAPSGTTYHAKQACNKAATIKRNAVQIDYRRPCARCNPQMPDLEWYWTYIKTRQTLKDYKIKVPK